MQAGPRLSRLLLVRVRGALSFGAKEIGLAAVWEHVHVGSHEAFKVGHVSRPLFSVLNC